MKRIYPIIVLLTILCAGCHNKEKEAMTETGFDVAIDTVRATRAKIQVTPQSDAAYYVCEVLNDTTFSTYPTDKQLTDYILNEYDAVWQLLYALATSFGSENTLDYNAIFLCRGTRLEKSSHLQPNTDYTNYVFQVNPQTRQAMGKVLRTPFHTASIDSANVNFDVRFSGDTLIVTPSDNNVPYLIDYELQSEVVENFIGGVSYCIETVEMYEEYGFVASLIHKGEMRKVLSEDVSMKDGEMYTLFVVGYNGELNTEPLIMDFTYRKPIK